MKNNITILNKSKVYIVTCVALKDTWVQKVFSCPERAKKYANRLKEISKIITERCPVWLESGENDKYYYYWQRWHFWMEVKDIYIMDFEIN